MKDIPIIGGNRAAAPTGGNAGGNPGNMGGNTGVPGVQIRCPRCQTAFTAQIINVVDAQRQPQLKSALLGGYLNRAVCPNCGGVSVLNVPLLYHDSKKELLMVLVPSELNMNAEQQQKLIGSMVQAIMKSLPAEERKGYFLRPQTILSMQRLVETVLEADGVTKEMIAAQNERFQLLETLIRALGDPAQMQAAIDANRAKLDYAFFATLVSTAQEAELTGDPQGAEELMNLRDRLLQDAELANRLPQPLPADVTVADAISRLLPLLAEPEALAAMVVMNQPLFDYAFFQGLTQQIDQARFAHDAERVDQLTRLRTAMLDEIKRQEQAMQAAQQEDLRVVDELLKLPDAKEIIRRNLPRFDTLFLNTLATAIQKAREQGDLERSAKLDGLRKTILDTMSESMPPEMRLINRLLGLAKPEDRQALLAENKANVNDDLVALLQQLIDELKARGPAETVRRMETILAEVQAALTPAQ